MPEPDTTPRDRVLAVLLAAVFMSMLCVTIVNVALPSIQTELGATAADVQWVLAGYSLTFGILLIPSGRAGDLFGHARLFLVGVAVFTLASLIAAFALSPLMLNLSRVLMGIGAGLFNPQVMGLIQRLYQGDDRARAIGSFAAVTAVGAAVGPVIGGALLTWLPPEIAWRSTFAINVPFGVVALGLALRWLPTAHPAYTSRRPDLDPVGVLLLAAATACLMTPFITRTWWLLAGTVAFGIGFVAWEHRYAERGRSPMVDLRLFALRSFSVGVTVFTFLFAGTINVYVIQTLFIQQGLGGTALLAGLVSLPPALLTGWGSHVAAKLVVRHGPRTLVWGFLILLVGISATIAVVFPITRGASIWWSALTLSILGIGMGIANSAVQTLALAEVQVAAGGTAAGILQTGQRIGSAIGMALIPGIWFATFPRGPAVAHGWAYATIGALALAGLIVALMAPARQAR